MVPRHSSEERRYIPMGYVSAEVICGDANLLIPDASLFEFGILTSNVHMAWVRTVAGRIKSDYRYSGQIVYNNFPWPNCSDEQKEKISKTAQAILDARAMYPNSRFAELYNVLTMPPELLRAHRTNDKAVWEAYGKAWRIDSEAECVASLLKLYLKQKIDVRGGDA